ncbi:MAG: DUF3800 domain-containing protein [Cytophagales bacterium]|nr:DUF3800 domain-containing protein [Cytophagales bacterium]
MNPRKSKKEAKQVETEWWVFSDESQWEVDEKNRDKKPFGTITAIYVKRSYYEEKFKSHMDKIWNEEEENFKNIESGLNERLTRLKKKLGEGGLSEDLKRETKKDIKSTEKNINTLEKRELKFTDIGSPEYIEMVKRILKKTFVPTKEDSDRNVIIETIIWSRPELEKWHEQSPPGDRSKEAEDIDFFADMYTFLLIERAVKKEEDMFLYGDRQDQLKKRWKKKKGPLDKVAEAFRKKKKLSEEDMKKKEYFIERLKPPSEDSKKHKIIQVADIISGAARFHWEKFSGYFSPSHWSEELTDFQKAQLTFVEWMHKWFRSEEDGLGIKRLKNTKSGMETSPPIKEDSVNFWRFRDRNLLKEKKQGKGEAKPESIFSEEELKESEKSEEELKKLEKSKEVEKPNGKRSPERVGGSCVAPSPFWGFLKYYACIVANILYDCMIDN